MRRRVQRARDPSVCAGRRRMMRGSRGTTLVELLVSILMVSILMVMVVGIVAPSFKIFMRMQKTQFAQMILDNTLQELKGQTREAVGYVKIYGTAAADGSGVLAADGSDTGGALEYMNTDGYVVLLSAGGCPETAVYRGTIQTGTADAAESGQMLLRYYWQRGTAGAADSEYFYKTDGAYSARAVTTSFARGYYMGNYLSLQFAFPSGTSEGDAVSYLEVTARLYEEPECINLVAEDSAVLDFRYLLTRKDGVTAKEGSVSGGAAPP